MTESETVLRDLLAECELGTPLDLAEVLRLVQQHLLKVLAELDTVRAVKNNLKKHFMEIYTNGICEKHRDKLPSIEKFVGQCLCCLIDK